MFGVVDTDPWPADNGQRLFFRRSGDIEIAADQVVSVEAPIDVHRFTEQSRALGSVVDIFHRLDGPQQDRGGVPFVLGHDIHAAVHAVDHKDVSVPGRAEHDFRPFGQPFCGMCREIMRSEVCLVLHDSADALQAAR